MKSGSPQLQQPVRRRCSPREVVSHERNRSSPHSPGLCAARGHHPDALLRANRGRGLLRSGFCRRDLEVGPVPALLAVSFMFWLGLTTGSLCLLMLQYVSGGNWGRLGRRIWEAAASNLWLVFLFGLPIAFGLKHIYPWASMPHEQAVKELGAYKVQYYLTPIWFYIRGGIYFLGWGVLYWRLRIWSQREEEGTTTPAQFVTIQNLSGFGIVFYALSIT